MKSSTIDKQRSRPISETVEVVYNGPDRQLLVLVEGMDGADRSRFMPIFEQFAWLVPTWCHRLYIDFEAPASGSNACACAHPEYRQATIMLREDFFVSTIENQRRMVCHELLHIALAPLQDKPRTLLNELIEKIDPAVGQTFRRLMTEWMEETTSDLENAICERMEHAIVERRDTPKRSGRRRTKAVRR